MKITVNALRLSAGTMEGNPYASLTILDETAAQQIDADRIDVGQQVAKLRLVTDENNRLAFDLARSGLLPGIIQVEVSQRVRAGEVSLTITGFSALKV